MAPPTQKLAFKSLAESDLPAILAIEKRSHITPWREAHFLSSIQGSHHVLGAYCEGQLIGYAVYSIVADEAELLLFVIDEPHQGRGFGKALLAHIIQNLDGKAERLFLEVRASNMPAIQLYETIGFNQVGERANYYSLPWGREDALIFALEILPSSELSN